MPGLPWTRAIGLSELAHPSWRGRGATAARASPPDIRSRSSRVCDRPTHCSDEMGSLVRDELSLNRLLFRSSTRERDQFIGRVLSSLDRVGRYVPSSVEWW